jgi:ketosteroid isomerase-like protein
VQESPETTQRVLEEVYAAMNRVDFDEWFARATSDYTVHEVPDLPDADVYRGRDEVRRWAETTLESVSGWHWAPEEFLFNDGGAAVVRVRLTAQSEAGVPIEITVFHAVEMRGNKMAVVRGFLDKAQALEAAGSAGA